MAKTNQNNSLQPEDFYINEEGFMVFTAAYHLKRGKCCRNGCKHCPYGYKKTQHSDSHFNNMGFFSANDNDISG